MQNWRIEQLCVHSVQQITVEIGIFENNILTPGCAWQRTFLPQQQNHQSNNTEEDDDAWQRTQIEEAKAGPS